MKRRNLTELLQHHIVLLDGATGTELSGRGMPGGVCPEQWVLDNPEALIDIQRAYIDAGSHAVYSCTFGGNRFKLDEFGLAHRARPINTALARISKEAAGDHALVLGDLAPTGRFVEPFGDLGFEEAVACYREQAEALLEGEVDGFVIETMMDLQEARAALIAVRETCDLPVLVTMTFGSEGRTLNGTDPLSAMITLQSLGATAVGCNCSTGPENMVQIIRDLKPYATVPLVAKPNAGMPKLRDGATVFDMSAEAFGDHGSSLVEAGVNILGGCCGTSPAYIRAMKARIESLSPKPPARRALAAVCSYRRSVLIGAEQGLTVIGERINPSGKNRLTEELREGRMTRVKQYAADQDRQGADLVDVNVHVPGTDEPDLMRRATLTVALSSSAPMVVDTLNPDAVEQALRVYPGRILLNSISNRSRHRERLLALARKYGSMIVCMPLDDHGVPETAERAADVIQSLLERSSELGIHRDDCMVDCLVFPASKGPDALSRTLALIAWCSREAKVASLVGISNVSYGLKERRWLDGTLLSMAASLGLTAAFVDTGSEHTLNLTYACDALLGRDPKFGRYLKRFAKSSSKKSAGPTKTTKRTPAEAVFDAVMQGDDDGIGPAIEKALAEGVAPRALVDDQLIPAINLVGEKFDRKEYFLPQLISCADAMRKGFEVLQPHLATQNGGGVTQGPQVLLATVQGDIHDIGKNIVALMLKNYSFEVIDLGKDVSAETIIRAVKQQGARIVGLSALMTTTMVEMKRVIDLAREEGLEDVCFMIGGAVVDQHYAEEIGAQGYAADALAAVRLAQGFGAGPRRGDDET
jgi:5-methyltetrahydrofolate--homocysteine methyltransferase